MVYSEGVKHCKYTLLHLLGLLFEIEILHANCAVCMQCSRSADKDEEHVPYIRIHLDFQTTRK